MARGPLAGPAGPSKFSTRTDGLSFQSSSDWTFISGFILKFIKINSAIFIFIKSVYNLFSLLMRYKYASRFHNNSKIFCCDWPKISKIKRIKSFKSIESWHWIQSLSELLSCIFNSDMSPPHILKFCCSVW